MDDYDDADILFNITEVTADRDCSYSIPLKTDDIYEGFETFSIVLTLDDSVSGVTLGRSRSTVSIIDDDGKCFLVLT